MSINNLSRQTGNNGEEYGQWETTDAILYPVIYIPVSDKEAGKLIIDFNGVNINTVAAADRYIIIRFKKVNNVISLIGRMAPFNNADTGMTAVDVTISASTDNTQIILSVTGIANTAVRHSIQVNKLSSAISSGGYG